MPTPDKEIDFGFDEPFTPRPATPTQASQSPRAPARGESHRWPRKLGGTAKPGKRLYVDMVPSTAWFSNLRSELSASEWEQVKKHVFRKADYCCEICDGQGPKWPVEAHERWSFDEKTGVQALTGIEALCPDCHESTHFGLAQMRHRDKQAFQHLLKVNQWTPPRGVAHINEANITWQRRSSQEWVLDARALLEMPIRLEESTRARILQLAEDALERVVKPKDQAIIDEYAHIDPLPSRGM